MPSATWPEAGTPAAAAARSHAFAWPGGRSGVLLVHGLAGTPVEMRFVARGLHRSEEHTSELQSR